jgi:predicted dehydrogenase
VVEFKSGALGILDTSWVHRTGPNPLEIYGTEGYIGRAVAPGQGLIMASQQLGVEGYILPSKLPAALPTPIEQWVGACLHGKPSTITVEDGRNLTEMLEGIYAAARTRAEHRFA